MYWTSTTIENFVLVILAVIVIILFVWAIYAFLMAIFQFIFSKWETEKIKKAWNNIRYMILWVILSFLLLFVFPIVFQRLEIPWYEQYTAQNIFERAWDLVKVIIWWDSDDTYSPTQRGGTPEL